MLKVYYEGFTAYVRNALYDRYNDHLFYLELVGLSGVDSVCAGALRDRILYVYPNGNRLDLSLFRWGTRIVYDNEENQREKNHQIKWKWKQKAYGPLRHAILYPEEILNAWREDAPMPRVVMGRNEREAKDNLWRFLQLVLDFPVPEDRDLPYLMDLIRVAVEHEREDVLNAIRPLEAIGEVRGWIVKSIPALREILQRFYSHLIKEGEIRLKGREVPLKEDTLEAFLDHWGQPLTKKVLEMYRPLYEAGSGLSEIDGRIARLRRKPFPAQREAINALYNALFKQGHDRAVLCGEQGTGKTFMALALIGAAPKPMRVLVVCPPHLVPKWAREARETIPGVKTVTLNGKETLQKLRTLQERETPPEAPEIWIMGRERMKLSFAWEPAVVPAKVKKSRESKSRENRIVPLPAHKADPEFPFYLCPNCHAPIYKKFEKDEDEEEKVVPADWKWLTAARRACQECGAPLWQPNTINLRVKRSRLGMTFPGQPRKNGFRRYAPAEFIKKKLKGRFDLLIVDECHEYKAQNTAQANSVGGLLSACRKALFLTGTLMGGYATDVFYLYFRAFPRDFKRDGWEWSSGTQFLKRYGVLEEVEVLKEKEEDNRFSRGRKTRKVYVKARPGVSPEVLARFLLPHTVFVRLDDMASELPPYEEVYVALDRGDEDLGEYARCQEAYEKAAKSCMSTKARLAIASKFVAVLMNLPDCVRHLENEIWRDVLDDEGNVVRRELLYQTEIVSGGPLAKERWLAELIKRERQAGRRVLVYCTYTGEKDITRRLAGVLKDLGVSAVVLPSSISTDKREEWIRRHTAMADAMICNPKLVETGLDLFDFPTVVFYQPGYRVYTLRQAARRSWRLGQRQPVRVYFLAAGGTIQEDAWALIAQKWNVSLAVEGELVTEGFATEFDTGGSILGELAKKLDRGEIGRATAEAAFKRLKQAEAVAQAFLTEREAEAPKAVMEVETTVKEVQRTIAPKTLIVSIAKVKGRRKTRWTRMEIRPEDLERIKREAGGPVQLGLF